ncbi:hypothetical protein OHC51_03795 [Stenotrophomonas indicatrix]|uniref:hypothetical protein n=1 Tax=Stenotrophomonas indicatrix TaxID=2045451 RepID=UPI0030092B7F
MLRTFPESLLNYAVDDTLQGNCVERALGAERVLKSARDRAKRECEDARVQMNQLRERAVRDGYREGLMRAMANLVPLLQVLQQAPDQICAAVHEQIRQRIQALAACPEVVVSQLLAACDYCLGSNPDRLPVRLYVPRAQEELVSVIRAEDALKELQIQLSDREQLLVEIGPMAYALDLVGVLDGAASGALQQQLPRLQSVVEQRASDYCNQVLDELRCGDERKRFKSLGEIQ